MPHAVPSCMDNDPSGIDGCSWNQRRFRVHAVFCFGTPIGQEGFCNMRSRLCVTFLEERLRDHVVQLSQIGIHGPIFQLS